DEPSVLELQIDLLESNGARVTSARSGSRAIRCLEEGTFDLIITDLRMPGGVSGQDLFEWIRDNRPDAVQRVVFVTGDTMGEDSQSFLSGLPNRCLIKPFSVEEYVSLVKEVLDDSAVPV
ncbi:MAG TPA: response regulator, partial [Candidatus Saccharimonadales bacterium]|nr:response regulator [Candidatus Saccharimonadales bacterium]